MFIQHCRLSSALHLHLNKEVSIKKSLNYLGVSSRQRENTVKALLCINCSGREVTETSGCILGEAGRAHPGQHRCHFKHIVIVFMQMRLKLFSLAQILSCIGNLVRDLFYGKLKNQVKKKSRRNYLKNMHNNHSQSNLIISDGHQRNWQIHAFMGSSLSSLMEVSRLLKLPPNEGKGLCVSTP